MAIEKAEVEAEFPNSTVTFVPGSTDLIDLVGRALQTASNTGRGNAKLSDFAWQFYTVKGDVMGYGVGCAFKKGEGGILFSDYRTWQVKDPEGNPNPLYDGYAVANELNAL